MKIRYFADTDTLHIEFRVAPVSETRDLDENTVLDVDAKGNICSITVEHASERAGIPEFSCNYSGPTEGGIFAWCFGLRQTSQESMRRFGYVEGSGSGTVP